jgi:hypothetical protein
MAFDFFNISGCLLKRIQIQKIVLQRKVVYDDANGFEAGSFQDGLLINILQNHLIYMSWLVLGNETTNSK